MNDLFQRGFIELGTWRGLRMRLHWTFFLGLLAFGGMRFVPGFWLGFTLLLLVHELGHAALVRLYGYHVLSIELTGIGGLCRWSGYPTAAQRSAIAWGGVLGQLLLLVPAAVLMFVLRPHWLLGDFLYALTWSNLLLIGLNLIPVPMFDGYEAWRLFRIPRWWSGVLPARLRSRTSSSQGNRRKGGASGGTGGWFPRGVGLGANSKKRKASHLRDVSLDREQPPDEVAAELLRIAQEAKKARNRPN